MSPKNTLLAAGLSALGLLGFAPPDVANPPGSAPPGLPASAAPSPPYTVLLLSDGRLHQGTITEDPTGYVVDTRYGTIPVPKRLVEKAFRSVEEAYQYRSDHVPDRDLGERMKLVRWCMTNHLTAHAKEHLQVVVARSPSYGEARAMLSSIEKAEARASLPRVDAEVRQARADVEDRPEKIDPNLLLRARRELGISNLPQIAGLPPALAVKRAGEFNALIQPILQKNCVHCHNEGYAGSFQLIKIRNRHDLKPEVFRANLDATLRLIDTENPGKSDLLSSALVPHGSGSNKRPIFRGANDPEYQILAAWVNSLRPPKAPGEEVASSRFEARPAPVGGEGFATDRGAPSPLPFLPTPAPVGQRPLAPPAEDAVTPQPPGRFVPGSGAGVQPYAPPDTEFPAPYMAGGPKPRLDPAPGPGPAPAAAPAPATDESDEDVPAPRKPRKPVKVDPALLQRALMQRNAQP